MHVRLSIQMYKLAIGALFKNEAHCMREWLEHYLARGVEHFYLINDGSTDNFMEILLAYIDRGVVSLFNATWDRYLGRQRDMYNHYILPRLHETRWILMVDLDEFVWSPQGTNFPHLLETYFKRLAQLQINHTYFGSNGHDTQPASLVGGFTRRSLDIPSKSEGYKYFLNTEYKFTSINVHYADHADPEDKAKRFEMFSQDWWRLNHYSCQSREFWVKIKCTRGDSDNYRTRTEDDGFKELDHNDVEDLGLYEQNHALGLC